MSRKLILTTATLMMATLALGACQRQKTANVVVGGHPLTVAGTLDCPEHEGKLDRKSVAADGQSCVYSGDMGWEVILSRLPLNNQSVDVALAGVETNLHALLASDAVQASPAPKPPTPPAAPGASSSHTESWSSDDEGDGDAEKTVTVDKTNKSGKPGHHEHDRADINLPGLHIKTDGDKAEISMPGLKVHANDDGAQVETGWAGLKNAVINANDSGATIRANSTDAANTERTWMQVTDRGGSDVYHTVGYMARGPLSGPLVMAQVKSKELHEHNFGRNFGFDDVKKLIGRNVK